MAPVNRSGPGVLDGPLAFVDVETTGTAPTACRITEIAVVCVDEGSRIDEWSTLVDPECTIPEAIQALTGITNGMVRSAPTFSAIRSEVLARLEGRLFVAHNARFDYAFVKNEMERSGASFRAEVLCTVRLSRRLFPEAVGHGLDAVVARHRLEESFSSPGRGGRHSALGDARVLWHFVQAARRSCGEEAVEAAARRILKMPSLPPQLAPDALEALPEAPGVYRFYGVNDLPIYVGKSVNLRDRVRSHFSSDHRNANDLRLSAEIRRIEFEETAGELGALLREAELVKSDLPLHNARLRRKQTACFLELPAFDRPPEFRPAGDLDWSSRGPESPAIYGPFTTRDHARAHLEELAAAQGLCWRLLGWEKRGGPCFARQLRRCRGACVGEESAAVHGLRLATALAPAKLRDWPWPGRVVIRERSARSGRCAAHVFDRWFHLGTAQDEAGLEEILATRCEIGFDPDTYRILVRYLDEPPAGALPVESVERRAA